MELHSPRKQGIGEGAERRGEVQQRLDPQQVGDERLAIIGGGQRRERELQSTEREVEEQQHPEHLSLLPHRHVPVLDQRIGEAVAIQHVKQHQHDPGHRDEAIIPRRQQPDDEEGRRPRHNLPDDLAPGTPDNGAAHLLAERFGWGRG